MGRQLVLIHGRSQQNKNAVALKAEWLDALDEGFQKSGLSLPIAEPDVRFPYYGDTLIQMTEGQSADTAADVIVRGEGASDDEARFTRAVLEEMRKEAGITDAQLAEVVGQDVVDRGPQNWGWVQGILKAVDRFVPHGSGAGIALATKDVYQYLKNPAVQQEIDEGVAQAFTPGVETIVVSHSLGTVVAYNLLRREGHRRGWKVPLFITLGSPLGVTEIRRTMSASGALRCPECASAWFNAMDERDVVALFALTPRAFPLDPANPAIENKTDVRNRTDNRHGISGYLDDAEVARRIHAALKA